MSAHEDAAVMLRDMSDRPDRYATPGGRILLRRTADALDARSLLQREAIRAARVARDEVFATRSATRAELALSRALDALGDP